MSDWRRAPLRYSGQGRPHWVGEDGTSGRACVKGLGPGRAGHTRNARWGFSEGAGEGRRRPEGPDHVGRCRGWIPSSGGAVCDFPQRRTFLFMRANPREGAVLEASATLLWGLGPALAHGRRHNDLPFQSLRVASEW